MFLAPSNTDGVSMKYSLMTSMQLTEQWRQDYGLVSFAVEYGYMQVMSNGVYVVMRWRDACCSNLHSQQSEDGERCTHHILGIVMHAAGR